FIDWFGQVNTNPTSVHYGHQQDDEAQIPVTRRIWCTEFETFGARSGTSHWNTDGSIPVAQRIQHDDGSSKAFNQTFIRGHGRVSERQDGGSVSQQATDVPPSDIR